MTTAVTAGDLPLLPSHDSIRGPMTSRWLRRSLFLWVALWLMAVVGPWVLNLSPAWTAFGTGLVVPGAGLLYSIPDAHHEVTTSHLLGHLATSVFALGALAIALSARKALAGLIFVIGIALLIVGVLQSPHAIVVTGHIVAFVGVLVACGWAFVLRLVPEADFTTLPAIVVGSAIVGALLAHDHEGRVGPATWVPWAALITALGITVLGLVRESYRHRAWRAVGARRRAHLESSSAARPPATTDVVELHHGSGAPVVTEADADELRLLRYLMGTALQPLDSWDAFDPEVAIGPVSRYRYQMNTLGWALATYSYSHTPAYAGALVDAQVGVIDRLQHKRVWGYWYWQNLLGNYDFAQRRPDPIDVPQNIMFSAYLNLQLAMFHQATGDTRYDQPGAVTFAWSPQQRFSFNHAQINEVVVRNFQEDLCLWPCEPSPFGRGRTSGFVFPYCNAVAVASIAVTDRLRGTHLAPPIAAAVEQKLAQEFTTAAGDLVTFTWSGLGLAARMVMGPTVTAGVASLLNPLRPDLGWAAWEMLRSEWLDTGEFRVRDSAGRAHRDWADNAPTNAAPLAAAMLLARERGETAWRDELLEAAVDQLDFVDREGQPGVASFARGSVWANGLLAFGAFGRGPILGDMMALGRPTAWNEGPRLVDAPHPDVLVARAVSDGVGLDLVLRPGRERNRFALHVDRLTPGASYVAEGAVDSDLVADCDGRAAVLVDLTERTEIRLRASRR